MYYIVLSQSIILTYSHNNLLKNMSIYKLEV